MPSAGDLRTEQIPRKKMEAARAMLRDLPAGVVAPDPLRKIVVELYDFIDDKRKAQVTWAQIHRAITAHTAISISSLTRYYEEEQERRRRLKTSKARK